MPRELTKPCFTCATSGKAGRKRARASHCPTAPRGFRWAPDSSTQAWAGEDALGTILPVLCPLPEHPTTNPSASWCTPALYEVRLRARMRGKTPAAVGAVGPYTACSPSSELPRSLLQPLPFPGSAFSRTNA